MISSSNTPKWRLMTSSSGLRSPIADRRQRRCNSCLRSGFATPGGGGGGCRRRNSPHPEPTLSTARRSMSPTTISDTSGSIARVLLKLLFAENETNSDRLWGAANASPFVKVALVDTSSRRRKGRGQSGGFRNEGCCTVSTASCPECFEHHPPPTLCESGRSTICWSRRGIHRADGGSGCVFTIR